MNKGPRFAKAYTRIMRDPTLSMGAKCVWLVIKTYANKEGVAWPSRERIAEDLGVSLKPVKTALKELKERRLLSWTKGGEGKSNVYLLDDAHYAKYLAKRAVPTGTVQAVPSGTSKYIHEEESSVVLEVEPGKIIHLTCKPIHYRPARKNGQG